MYACRAVSSLACASASLVASDWISSAARSRRRRDLTRAPRTEQLLERGDVRLPGRQLLGLRVSQLGRQRLDLQRSALRPVVLGLSLPKPCRSSLNRPVATLNATRTLAPLADLAPASILDVLEHLLLFSGSPRELLPELLLRRRLHRDAVAVCVVVHPTQ